MFILTNENILGYYHYLLKDHWQSYAITEDELIIIRKFKSHNQNDKKEILCIFNHL